MTTSYITDHEEQALIRLLQQYKGKDLVEGLIKALFTGQIQELEDSLEDLYDRLNIDTQEGTQLDNIGDYIGQDRLGFLDTVYRILLRARIARNISEGDIERVISSWKLLSGSSIVQLIECYPAEINLYYDAPISDELIDIAIQLMNETVLGGVSLQFIAVYSPGSSFGFNGADGVLGFGDFNDPALGGTFAYIQDTGALIVISDPTDAFGFDGPDTNIKGFSSTLFPLVGGKFSYIA